MTNGTSKKIEEYILYVLALLLPIFVWSGFSNPYTTPKIALLLLLLALIVTIKCVKAITRGEITLQTGSFDIPVVLLAVAYLISALTQTPNRMEAFLLPGTATVIAAGAILYFVINQTDKSARKNLRLILFASGVVVSLNVLLASTGILKNMTILPPLMRNNNFNTLGGAIPAFVYLFAVLPFGVGALTIERDLAKKVFLGVSASIMALAILMSGFGILPNNKISQMPSFDTSWAVATEAMKASPLFGVGPGNYLTAFNRFRPIGYNLTEQWSVRYTSAHAFVLTAATEAGLTALAAIIMLAFAIFKQSQESLKSKNPNELLSSDNSVYLSLLIIGVLLLLLPATPMTLLLLFIILGLSSQNKTVKLGMFSTSHEHAHEVGSKLPVLIITVPVIIGAVAISYLTLRASSAEMTYKTAVNAISRNDGRAAYDSLRGAIATNPYVDRYHVSYAQVNLALANSIAQKQNLTDDERNTVAQLIQQAIREGKVAVALNAQRAGSWEVLASIYRAIIPLAKGADAYAVQTYSQAVLLDPLNPNTRIALGGIYYAAKAYDDAIDIFKLAVRAKPDHANAHYNLGVAYREKGDVDRAITELQTVLSLVQNGSDDYKLAQKTLEDLQNKKKAGEATDSTNLTTPTQNEPADTQIDLPEDAAPPTAEPEATAGPTTTGSPTPTPSL